MAISKLQASSLESNATNLVHIKTITLSSSSSAFTFLDDDSDVTFDDTYKMYKFFGSVNINIDSTGFYVRFSLDGTNIDSTTDGYYYDRLTAIDDSTAVSNDNSSSVMLFTQNNHGNATGEFMNFECTIINSEFTYPRLTFRNFANQSDGGSQLIVGQGRRLTSGKAKGITFFPSSSRSWVANSFVAMYGVKS